MLTRMIVPVVLLAVSMCAAADDKAELQRLAGLWHGSAKSVVNVNGQKTEVKKDYYLEFSGDRFVVHKNENGKVAPDFDGDLKIDPAQKPAHIDLVRSDGGTMKLIYALEGDKLKIGFPLKGSERPRTFEAARTVTFERTKPAKGKDR
ncbi:MAG: TIGR03067 domain-containing protein [Gemmataceae bacterium]